MSMRYPGGFIASTPVTAAYPSGVWTQAQAIPYQAQNVWTRDQYWPYTTLLLQGNGTNGAQNNTFLDSSSNNFTITRNGNTTQGSFTPYEQDGYWSNYFDGNGDYLTAPNNTALDLSTGDFTVECWFYVTSVAVARPLFGRNNGNIATPSDLQYGMYLQAGGNVVVRPYQGGTDYTTVVGTAVINAWNHVALVRTGNTFYGFLNGVRGSTSQTISGALNTGSWLTYIGGGLSSGLGNDWMLGYISNVRVVKGTALYISSFTPSAAPLTAVTNTSLLTCQSNRFRDNSTNNFAITSFGDTSVQAFQPFPGATTYSGTVLGGSGYFDGSGDFLSIADNDALDFGTGNFTVEFWFNLTVSQDSAVATGWPTSGVVSGWSADVANTGIGFTSAVSDSYITATQSSTVPNNTWNHFAAVRNGSTVTVYLNGVGGTPVTNTQSINTQSSGMYIGRSTYNPNPRPFQGYVANFRILKGVAQYTANFTPPTTPVTAITNTSLLLNFTNAGIFDAAAMNDLETVGNAQVSTSVVKYGTGSMAFDGNGDYLSLLNTPNLLFGAGDMTIECWVWPNSISGLDTIVDTRPSGGYGSAGMTFQLTNGVPNFYCGAFSEVSAVISGVSAINTSVWTHIAMSRAGGVNRLFVNGVLVASNSNAWTQTFTASNPYYIGQTVGIDRPFDGYIDDLRITKGAARYITNFTPPPARMPGQ